MNAPHHRSADTEGTGQMSPNGRPPAASPILAAPASEQGERAEWVRIDEVHAIIQQARDSICAGGLAENAQHERSVVEPYLDGIADELDELSRASLRASPAVPVAQDERENRILRSLLREAIEYLIDAHPSGDSEFIRTCRAALSAATPPAVSAEAREWTQEQLDAMTHDAMVDALRDRGDDPLSREVANALAYFIAQDGLLGKAEREAEKLAAELAETKRPLEEQMARLNKRVTELNADAARLDWLDATNKRFRMGWKVGVAPAGNCSVQAIIMGGQSIREAIDAAMAPPAEGEQK